MPCRLPQIERREQRLLEIIYVYHVIIKMHTTHHHHLTSAKSGSFFGDIQMHKPKRCAHLDYVQQRLLLGGHVPFVVGSHSHHRHTSFPLYPALRSGVIIEGSHLLNVSQVFQSGECQAIVPPLLFRACIFCTPPLLTSHTFIEPGPLVIWAERKAKFQSFSNRTSGSGENVGEWGS